MLLVNCATPSWFLTLQVALQIVFALVTILVAFYSYKVYKLSKQRSIMIFGVAFLGMGAAYAIQAVLNYAVVIGVSTTNIIGTSATSSVIPLSVVAVFLHMFAMTGGLILLSYVTLKERSFKLFSLISSLAFVALLFSSHPQLVFFLITGLLLFFITGQHIQRYARSNSKGSLYVGVGFGLWLLGQTQLALAHFFDGLYVSGHVFVLAAFIVFLWNLARMFVKK